MVIGLVGGFNYVLNSHATLNFDGTKVSMSRPDGILGATYYTRYTRYTSASDNVVGGLVNGSVRKLGLREELFCRDDDSGFGSGADGLCDIICIHECFSKKACFTRNEDYDTHRFEFEKADKMYKDTRERFANSFF